MKYPFKLKAGDTIRVIATSGSNQYLDIDKKRKAEDFFAERDITVTYGRHLEAGRLGLDTPPLDDRLKDIEEAILDDTVKAIWCLGGGENANQLVPHLPYKKFKRNNKIFIGHSDNTVLCNALMAKAGVCTYYGPNFSAVGGSSGVQLTHQSLDDVVFSDLMYSYDTTITWYDSDYSQQPPQKTKHNDHSGWWCINHGGAEGEVVGGELSTFALLQGTDYMPNLANKIVAVEMYRGSLATFDRLLESLLLQKNAQKIEGLVIARFQQEADIDREILTALLRSKEQLKGIPIIANVDFGHTKPRLTMPIGGVMQFYAHDTHKQYIRVGEH